MRETLATLLICALASYASAQELKPAAPPEPEGMIRMFNGTDLDGWEGDMRLWSVKDGAIRGETTAENPTYGNTFLVWQGGELKDFELRLSFRIERGNSGVQYRSKLMPARPDARNRYVVRGYQAEVENTPGKVGFLYHEGGRGWLVNVGDKAVIEEDGKVQVVGKLGDRNELGRTYKRGDWNEYIIICRGNHVQHYLNGYQTIDLIDNDIEPALEKDGRPNPFKARCDSGIIALQIHSGPPMWVEFKDIRLKKLD
jgi:hypothetical protein